MSEINGSEAARPQRGSHCIPSVCLGGDRNVVGRYERIDILTCSQPRQQRPDLPVNVLEFLPAPLDFLQ